jgi:hypothetical protein
MRKSMIEYPPHPIMEAKQTIYNNLNNDRESFDF